MRLLGNDIHEGALSLCKKDAQTAGVLHLLDLSCEDCQDYQPPVVPSLVVTNPPWGERLTDSRFVHVSHFHNLFAMRGLYLLHMLVIFPGKACSHDQASG